MLTLGRRWIVACAIAYALVPTPSAAYDFVLVGGGTDQHLNWRWETAYPAQSCQSWPVACGDFSSTNGNVYNTFNIGFTNSFFENHQVNTGGGVTWTGDDSLKVSATTSVGARAFAGFQGLGPPGWAESWAAVDAREVPMVFQLLSAPGAAPTTQLKITPQLVGSFTTTTANGGSAHVQIQMELAVWVNGIAATGDTLYSEWEDVGAGVIARPLGLPKGGLSLVVIPNVSISSQITVRLWAYSRVHGEMTGALQSQGQINGTGPVGSGPSLVLLVQPLGVTAVGDAPPGSDLALSALPNPSRGPTRVRYTLSRSSRVLVSVHDITGRRVATVAEGDQLAGAHDVAWSGLDEGGSSVPPGVYLLRMVAGTERRSVKLVRLEGGPR